MIFLNISHGFLAHGLPVQEEQIFKKKKKIKAFFADLKKILFKNGIPEGLKDDLRDPAE